MAVVVESDRVTAEALRTAAGSAAEILSSVDALEVYLAAHPEIDVVVMGPSQETHRVFRVTQAMRISRPALGVVLVRRRIENAVLAEALRAGVRDVVEERDMALLAKAVRQQREISKQMTEQSDASGPAAKHAQTITVFSAKGGCGKTTLATNMAAVLARSGARVGLLDLDLSFGDVAIALQMFPSHSILDAVKMQDSLDSEGLDRLLTPHESGLKALTAPVSPDGRSLISESLVDSVIRLMAQELDYLVIDTPPDLDEHVLVAFDRSQHLVLLLTPDIPALKNLKLTVEMLGVLNYPKDRVSVVVNRADADVGLTLKEIEKTLKLPLSGTIPSSRDVPISTNRGELITMTSPKHPVSASIESFVAQHLLDGDTTTASAAEGSHVDGDRPPSTPGRHRSGRRRGLFGRRDRLHHEPR